MSGTLPSGRPVGKGSYRTSFRDFSPFFADKGAYAMRPAVFFARVLYTLIASRVLPIEAPPNGATEETTMKTSTLNLALLTLTLGAVACGDLETNTQKPATLATVRGTVTSSSATNLGGNLRVAVVWKLGTTGGNFVAAEDIAISPTFPAGFDLDISKPPPVEAMQTELEGNDESASAPDEIAATGAPTPDPAMPQAVTAPTPAPFPAERIPPTMPSSSKLFIRHAFGALVVYEDKNANGRLDLVDNNRADFIDRVVGTTNSVLFWFYDPIPPNGSFLERPDGTRPQTGYNWLFGAPFLISEDTQTGLDQLTWRPLTTPITFELSDNPRLAELMCRQDAGTGDDPDSITTGIGFSQLGPGPNGVYPKANDPNLDCKADLPDAYIYTQCKAVKTGLCIRGYEECVATEWSRPTGAAAAGWPCPSK